MKLRSSRKGRIQDFHKLVEDGDDAAVLQWLQIQNVTPQTYYQDAKTCFSSTDFRAVGLATFNGHRGVVRSLINKGFNSQEMTSHFGFPECTPTHLACEKGHVAVVKMLIEEFAIDVNMDVYFSPLQWAARYGQLDVVKYLVDAGAQMDTEEECLIFEDAAEKGFPEILDFLISRTPEVYTHPRYDYTPLHIAACAGFVGTARALIDAGADVNRTDSVHETPFLVAVPHGKSDMLRFLISRDADPEIVNSYGDTALHQAIMFRHFDIVHYLIGELNISLSKTNSSGDTPLACLLKFHPSKDEDVIEIINFIVKAGHNPVEVVDIGDDNDDEDSCATESWRRTVLELKYVASNPRSLREMSVFGIRCLLGKRLLSAVNNLPVPQLIKDILLLRD